MGMLYEQYGRLCDEYEALCARAARAYADGRDTEAIDLECDRLQARLEAQEAYFEQVAANRALAPA